MTQSLRGQRQLPTSLLNKNVDVILAGRGLLIRDQFAKEAVELSGKRRPRVLLVPTPIHTKTDYEHFVAQGKHLFGAQLGGMVRVLHGYNKAPTAREIGFIARSDIIWVAGGNTEYMMHFWGRYGRLHEADTNIMQKIAAAAEAGAVVGGGSAGMLAWCTAGLSDSDSYTYHDSSLPLNGWEYKIVRGLGLVNAFGNPHHDQPAYNSNATRKEVFESVYRRRENTWLPDTGIGVPHDGALVLHGTSGRHHYKVLATTANDQVTIVHRRQHRQGGVLLSQTLQLPQTASFRPMSELLLGANGGAQATAQL